MIIRQYVKIGGAPASKVRTGGHERLSLHLQK